MIWAYRAFSSKMHLLFAHHSRRRNKSSVTASMFRDGCTLLSIMPREDEHYRRSKQCGIDAVRFDQEICIRRILLCTIFFSQPFAWSKARSDLCARCPFPSACFGLLNNKLNIPTPLELVGKNRFANLNVLINPGNASTRLGQKSWSPAYKISRCVCVNIKSATLKFFILRIRTEKIKLISE